MLLLTSTSDLLQLVTSAARTLDVHASWIDFADTGARTPGRTNTAITTATTTTVAGSPAASTQRNVKRLTARNKDSTALDVTVKHTDGSTAVELFKATLAAGDCLTFDEEGFRVFDSSGNLKVS